MRVLALDLSMSATGWALFADGEERPTVGVWEELASSAEYRARAYLRLQQNIVDLHRLGAIDHICWEKPLDYSAIEKMDRHNKPEVPIVLHGLAEHCLSLSEALCIARSNVPAGTWRRHFLGAMPRTDEVRDLKLMAIKRAEALGLTVPRTRTGAKSHDAAEAFGILDYKLNALRIMPPWHRELVLTGAS
jgi:hypothetical protein